MEVQVQEQVNADVEEKVSESIAEDDNNKEVEISAEETSIDMFTVIDLEDGTVKLSDYNGDSSDVVIPDNVNGKTVSAIGKNTFVNHNEIITVKIPDTIKIIGDGAFMNCDNIEHVKMSKNIEVIEASAFGTKSLKSLELPNTLTKLGTCAVSGCGITELTIPTSLTELEGGVFADLDIETVTIPANIKKIGGQAFDNCPNLKTVVIEDGVEELGEYVFQHCTNLESVTIPSSVTFMESNILHRLGDNVTIYAPAGSYAETWAADNYVKFVAQ